MRTGWGSRSLLLDGHEAGGRHLATASGRSLERSAWESGGRNRLLIDMCWRSPESDDPALPTGPAFCGCERVYQGREQLRPHGAHASPGTSPALTPPGGALTTRAHPGQQGWRPGTGPEAGELGPQEAPSRRHHPKGPPRALGRGWRTAT